MKRTAWTAIWAIALILFGTQAWSANGGGMERVDFRPDPKDKTYYVLVVDNSPYGLNHLPQVGKMMYELGFDKALGPSSADVEIQIFFRGGIAERQGERLAHGIGGALIGAALGAAIGAAAGDPGAGAAIGAASGGITGLAAPTYASEMLDVKFKLRNRKHAGEFRTQLNLGGIAPVDYPRYVDEQLANMLYEIMDR